MYITVREVAEHININELIRILSARLASSIDKAVMQTVLDEGDLSGFVADQVALAQRALAEINIKIEFVDALIHSFVTQRYENGLTPAQIASSVLPTLAAKLVKYELMPTRDEDTRTEAKMARDTLNHIAESKINLGADDPSPIASSGRVAVNQSHSRFNWTQFGL